MKFSTLIITLFISITSQATVGVRLSENELYSEALNKACSKEISAWVDSNMNFEENTSDEDLEQIEAIEHQMYSCIEKFNKSITNN